MAPTIVVIAAGEMGAGVGARLVRRGARVLTSLAGRGAASRMRAERAGMIALEDERALIAAADFLLSIVPPGSALDFARGLAPSLKAAGRKPIFVDCNAVSPATAIEIGDALVAAECPYVDAGIVGGPPRADDAGPRFYASGPHAGAFARLGDYGLDIREVEGEIGAASALKLAYASLTKGLTALGAVSLLAAERAGVAGPLRAELAASQPAMLAFLERQMPAMYGKAYRFVAEMEEIAAFLEADPAGAGIYRGVADLYRRIAADLDGAEVASLKAQTEKGR